MVLLLFLTPARGEPLREQARKLAPKDPRLRAFLATTFRKSGQYEQALALLEPLVPAYPRDRLLWFDIGMSHYLAGRYAAGARAFEAMLGIDPDDLAAHYNLMRCLRRLSTPCSKSPPT